MNSNQFCTDIRRIYNREKDVSDDLELEDRQIMFWLDQKRGNYLENNPNRMKINDQFFQEYRDSAGSSCVELCRVDKAECDNITYGCESLKLPVPLPPLLYMDSMESLRVNLVDKISRIYYTGPDNLRNQLSTQLGRGFNWCTMIGQTLYVIPAATQWGNFSIINIRGIFMEPEKMPNFNFYNDAYPCPAGLMNTIKLDILTKELGIALQMTEDSTNDSRDNK